MFFFFSFLNVHSIRERKHAHAEKSLIVCDILNNLFELFLIFTTVLYFVSVNSKTHERVNDDVIVNHKQHTVCTQTNGPRGGVRENRLCSEHFLLNITHLKGPLTLTETILL